MSPSITSSISNFLSGIAGVMISLFNSLLAVFTAILALGGDIIHSVLALAQHVVTMVLDLFQGVFGFVAANIVVIMVIGGVYYVYTQYQQGSRRGVKRT